MIWQELFLDQAPKYDGQFVIYTPAFIDDVT